MLHLYESEREQQETARLSEGESSDRFALCANIPLGLLLLSTQSKWRLALGIDTHKINKVLTLRNI